MQGIRLSQGQGSLLQCGKPSILHPIIYLLCGGMRGAAWRREERLAAYCWVFCLGKATKPSMAETTEVETLQEPALFIVRVINLNNIPLRGSSKLVGYFVHSFELKA